VSDLPPETPNATIRNLCIAERRPRYGGGATRVLVKDAVERPERELNEVPIEGDGEDDEPPAVYGVRAGRMHSIASLRAYDRAFQVRARLLSLGSKPARVSCPPHGGSELGGGAAQERYFRSQGVAAPGAAAAPTVDAVEGEFWRLVEAPSGSEVHTAMEKWRIVILRFGTARQIMVLERWTNPKPLGTIVYRAAI
jgi:hypothetical protein